MPSSVKSSVLLVAQGVEVISCESALGTPFQLQVMISDSANRQSKIDEALAQLDANDAAAIAYAQQHGLPDPTTPSN